MDPIHLVIITGSAILLIAIVMVLIARTTAKKLVHPPRVRGGWNPRELGLEHEDFTVKTSDGLRLKGWFIPGKRDETVIVLHGYTASKYDTEYIKPVVGILARHGYNVVVYDHRAHGDSEGDVTTLGHMEVDDLSRVIDWLIEEKKVSRKIGLIGYSMGGTITLKALAVENRIVAGIADSPYVDIVVSGRQRIKRVKEILRSILLLDYPLIVRFARKYTGVDLKELNMFNYAEKIQKPLLIIAGKNDDLVPLGQINELAKRIKAVNHHTEIWITNSRHVSAIRDYPKEYEEKVIGFFERWLK